MRIESHAMHLPNMFMESSQFHAGAGDIINDDLTIGRRRADGRVESPVRPLDIIGGQLVLVFCRNGTRRRVVSGRIGDDG